MGNKAFLIFSSYFVFIKAALLIFSNSSKFFFLIFFNAIICIFLILSYINSILEGPGYLDFSYPYPLVDKSLSFINYSNNLSGRVTTNEQLQYIKSQKYPDSIHYFKSQKWLVLRPDHNCAWATFIGKRNHKLFILFNFYGSIFSAIILFVCLNSIVFCIKLNIIFNFIWILGLYFLISAAFCLTFLAFLIIDIHNLIHNVTRFDQLRRINYHPGSGFQQVFGSKFFKLSWLFPNGAF